MISELIRKKMRDENLSSRKAAAQVGVAHTTILRAAENKNVDYASLKKICNWLGVPVSSAIDIRTSDDQSLMDKIALLVTIEPALTKVFAEVVGEIEKGNMSEADLLDIVAYANYKIKLSKG